MNTIKNIDANLDRIAKLDAKLNRIANPLADTQFQKIFHDYSELTATVSQLQRSFEPVIKGIEPLLQNESLLALSRSCQTLADQFAAYQQLYSGIEASVVALEPVLRVQRELYSAFTPAYLTEMQRVFSNVQRAIDFNAFSSFVASTRLSADFVKSLEMAQPFMDEEQAIECEQLLEISSADTSTDVTEEKRFDGSKCIDLLNLLIGIIALFLSLRPDPQMDELIELQKVENEISAEQLTSQQEQMELTKEQNELIHQVLELMEDFNNELDTLPMDGDESLDQVDALNKDEQLVIDPSEAPDQDQPQDNEHNELKSH